MKNSEMKANRFFTWHKARRRVALIQSHLSEGRTVYLCTMTKATKLTSKHINMIKAAKNGAFVQSGKNWLCIDGCGIKVAA
jgi:uncharacterized pyridoxamine 5'-phosphate oxidase family protein